MLHRRYLAGPAAPARGSGAAVATEAVQMGNPGMSPKLIGREVAVASTAVPRSTPRREIGDESATSLDIFVPLLAGTHSRERLRYTSPAGIQFSIGSAPLGRRGAKPLINRRGARPPPCSRGRPPNRGEACHLWKGAADDRDPSLRRRLFD